MCSGEDVRCGADERGLEVVDVWRVGCRGVGLEVVQVGSTVDPMGRINGRSSRSDLHIGYRVDPIVMIYGRSYSPDLW